MANPIGEIQSSDLHGMRITFLSEERLGVLFDRVRHLGSHVRKKDRAAEFKWIDNTLRRLGLISGGNSWSTYAVSCGSDGSGNYGVFIIQQPLDSCDPSKTLQYKTEPPL